MAISVCEVSLTESSLDLPEAENDPAAGAVVVFWGAVRAGEAGREITGIEYEAHRAMAEHQM
ncbi:MAG: molybdenum cofactor biosynthesis protein MoaE, partial [Verrucomicrobiaceae bacterium]|nr:molybdenum cofactor biosynthesis protein MoaE [Verrucomicrobiaceae bacterium]